MPRLSCKQSVEVGQVKAKQCSKYREPHVQRSQSGGLTACKYRNVQVSQCCWNTKFEMGYIKNEAMDRLRPDHKRFCLS